MQRVVRQTLAFAVNLAAQCSQLFCLRMKWDVAANFSAIDLDFPTRKRFCLNHSHPNHST